VIGIWSDTERYSMKLAPGTATRTGDPVQVSRLGNPLVNEVVLPAGLKDAFNGLTPNKDATIPEVVARVTDPELPKLLEAIYGVPAPEGPRNDLVEIFLTGIAKGAPTLDGSPAPIQADLNSHVLNVDKDQIQPAEMLRLNTSIKPAEKADRLGVLAGDLQGFPNGRRLGDDVIDISIQAVAGAAQTGKLVDALAAGDKVDTNDVEFSPQFPYVALPSAVTAADAVAAAAPPVSEGTAGGGRGPRFVRRHGRLGHRRRRQHRGHRGAGAAGVGQQQLDRRRSAVGSGRRGRCGGLRRAQCGVVPPSSQRRGSAGGRHH
jgi:hypothetical protein